MHKSDSVSSPIQKYVDSSVALTNDFDDYNHARRAIKESNLPIIDPNKVSVVFQSATSKKQVDFMERIAVNQPNAQILADLWNKKHLSHYGNIEFYHGKGYYMESIRNCDIQIIFRGDEVLKDLCLAEKSIFGGTVDLDIYFTMENICSDLLSRSDDFVSIYFNTDRNEIRCCSDALKIIFGKNCDQDCIDKLLSLSSEYIYEELINIFARDKELIGRLKKLNKIDREYCMSQKINMYNQDYAVNTKFMDILND